MPSFSYIFSNAQILGGANPLRTAGTMARSFFVTAQRPGDGLLYRFPAGALARAKWITADMLLEGTELAVFALVLQEGETGPECRLTFGLLNGAAARLRITTSIVGQNRWMLDREGAWLKPLVYGQRVGLEKVDRVKLMLERTGPRPVKWSMTPLVAQSAEPPPLENPLLPKGALIDQYGQTTLADWPGKIPSAVDLAIRLEEQASKAQQQKWPVAFSRWGGWSKRQVNATGFFRTHHDGNRWWLVDPDGCLFWSAGMDCVGPRGETNAAGLRQAFAWMPEKDPAFAPAFDANPRKFHRLYNPLIANFIRTFGPEDWYARWTEIALGQLKSFGLNTIGNWSDWQIARDAKFPYTRPLNHHFPDTPNVYRDFPDVFHAAFTADAAQVARQLAETRDDPAMLGYFLMNEPTWAFSSELPAVGMLYSTPQCETRKALAEFLRRRHGTDAALAEAWGIFTTYSLIARGHFDQPLNSTALGDLEAFSAIMVDKLFSTLSAECKKVDPNHLNLGARYYSAPPAWALAGMGSFDVFSMNCYEKGISAEALAAVAAQLQKPTLIGEWHFGALDGGLPAGGIGHVRTQNDRAKAYRVYLEGAAANPHCVGVHWFQMYDQSALGRFDGENYNIGFVDVCSRPYPELAAAARESHSRMYTVAAGTENPCAEAPEYLPKLFM